MTRAFRQALLPIVALSGGCNSILGISDHDLAPAGGGAGDEAGGSSASGAGHSSAGSSGAGVAQAGVTMGDAGASGSGGEAGASFGGSNDSAGDSNVGGISGIAGVGGVGTSGQGGVAGVGGVGVSGHGGVAGVGGVGTSGAGTSGSAGSGGRSGCSPACTGGMTCQAAQCACPAAKPDTCSNSCTDKNTDNLNCGSCGHSCLGGTCATGMCQPITLASGRTAPWALAVNTSGVYWLETKAVQAVPLNGGTVVPLVSSGYVWSPFAIAASASMVYFTNSGTGSNILNYNDAVMQVPVTGGGAPSEFARATNNVSSPWGLAVAGGTVYWLDEQFESIFKANEGAGGEKPARAYDGELGMYSYYGNLSVDGSNAYFPGTNGALFQVPLAGGALVALKAPGASSAAGVNQIAVQQGYVYWSSGYPTTPMTTTPINSIISKIPIGGGTISTVASGLAVSPALAADSSGIYWDDGDLKRTPLAGGTAVIVASAQTAGFIALDSQFVYWTNASGGTVMKVAK